MKSRRARRPRQVAAEGRRQSTANVSVRQAAQDAVIRWRQESRVLALREFACRLAGLKWNRALLTLLLDELYVDDVFDGMIGRPKDLTFARYPQAVAFAIGLRHSWRPDDLRMIERRLRLFSSPSASTSGAPRRLDVRAGSAVAGK